MRNQIRREPLLATKSITRLLTPSNGDSFAEVIPGWFGDAVSDSVLDSNARRGRTGELDSAQRGAKLSAHWGGVWTACSMCPGEHSPVSCSIGLLVVQVWKLLDAEKAFLPPLGPRPVLHGRIR